MDGLGQNALNFNFDNYNPYNYNKHETVRTTIDPYLLLPTFNFRE